MKKLLVILFSLMSLITYAQSGVGYLKYTVYNIVSNPVGAYPYDATQYANMLDTTKGATVHTRGITTAAIALNFVNQWTPSAVPNGGAYTAIKTDGFFIPKETGTYIFGIDGDDAVDLTINGTVVTSFYGGHGFGGYRYGTINLVAGQTYTFSTRYQNWGGGWGLRLVWKRPSQSQYSMQSDEVTTIASEPTKKARMNFDFGNNVDNTKFAIGSALSSTGWVDITNNLDSVKVSNGYKATITPGQVEWSLINPYETSRNGHRLQIDERVFGGTGINLNDIKSVKLFDIYEGPINPMDFNGWWKQWVVPGNIDLASKVAASSFQSNIRLQDGWYAFKADYSFTPVSVYKPQSVTLTTTNTLTTLYNSIVTVADVYLAFKELANNGIFGNQTGNEFTYGIQYKNADINDDGVFNETDCFALLQHLTGKKNLVDTFNLNKTLKLIPTATYNTIGKSNWNTSSSYLGDTYNFDINTGKAIDTINISGTWKGDVNLSHSAIPASNGITTMAVRTMSIVSNDVNITFDTEMIGDSIVATIKLDPLQQQVAGVQFNLNYDKSVINYSATQFKVNGSTTNFSKSLDEVVSIGSINTSGQTFSNTTTYTVSFKPNTKIDNILGLISISNCEIINTNGNILKAKIL